MPFCYVNPFLPIQSVDTHTLFAQKAVNVNIRAVLIPGIIPVLLIAYITVQKLFDLLSLYAASPFKLFVLQEKQFKCSLL